MRVYPITDAAHLARIEKEHAAAVANGMIRGQCAHASICCGTVCILPPGHAGVHQGGDFWWDETGPLHGLPV